MAKKGFQTAMSASVADQIITADVKKAKRLNLALDGNVCAQVEKIAIMRQIKEGRRVTITEILNELLREYVADHAEEVAAYDKING